MIPFFLGSILPFVNAFTNYLFLNYFSFKRITVFADQKISNIKKEKGCSLCCVGYSEPHLFGHIDSC